MRGPQRRAESEAWIGKTLEERYKVQEILQETGNHTVYIATHLRLRKPVAIKIIHPEFASDGDTAAHFAREAMAGAQFDHPNVVGIIDCGRLADGRTFLVTELVRGPNLGEFMRTQGRIHWSLACDLGAQIAEALVAAHSVGIVHRDVCPEHVLLEVRDDGSYWAKLTNFGVSRMSGNALVDPAHELGSTLTRTGKIFGTPGYLAPEQAVGEEVDEAADTYSLGVMLWECMNGRRLWEAASVEDALARQLQEVPGPLQPFEDGPVPESLALLLQQVLARDPRSRPRLIDPVASTLRRLAHGADFEESLVTMVPDMSGPTAVRRVNGDDDEGAERGGTVVADNFFFPTSASVSGGASLKVVLRDLVQVLVNLWRGAAGGTRLVLVMIAIAPLLLLTIIVLIGGGGEKAAKAEKGAEGGGVVVASVGRARGALSGAPTPEPLPAPPKIEPKAAAGAELPEELRPAVNLLFGADSDEAGRAAAAARLASYSPIEALPPVIRHSATVLSAEKCADRQAALAELRALDDLQALPVLKALDRSGRKGCGSSRKKTDCVGCMREDLARVVGRFEALAELRAKE